MLKFVGRRLLVSIPLLVIVPSVVFVLVAFVPGDAARSILGANATPEQYERLREALGLDRPLRERYGEWFLGAVQGDLGRSLISQDAVASMLGGRLSVTVTLVVGSTLVASILGIALGIAAALRSGALGRGVDALSLIGLAIPNFFLGLLLVATFAVAIPIFSATGYVPPTRSPIEWLRSIVLPVLTLALPGVAVIAKQTRDAMRDVLGQPFIRTLRACGLSRRSIVLKHAFRNAAIPVVTVIGLVFVAALSGTVVVESVFAMYGLGGMAVQATSQGDVPLIQGVALYFTVLVVVVNLVVDLAYGWLDPRVRVS